MGMEIRIPKLGMGMEEGRLVEWLVPDGSTVAEGAPLYSLESDKSIQEIEAPTSGVLRIKAEVDQTYEVGVLIGMIE